MRFVYIATFLISAISPLLANDPTSASLKTIYNTLDPLSITQHLAFYELYPNTVEGKRALDDAWKLLTRGHSLGQSHHLVLPTFDLQAIVSLITRQSFDPPVKLDENQLVLMEKISSTLTNRRLKGSSVWTKEEVYALPPSEIDLGRGLLINQFDESKNPQEDIRQYEASIDLMALQILARLPPNPTPYDKIREINRFIFLEMQFRFPPHSLHAKDIDLYTFLPSVLDSRQGVCLGVSILYLCLAQRLDLSLEIITPPGHIYVRYRNGKEITNIETTARGIDLPTDTYLGINTCRLEERNIKEVIGLAFFNQAAVAWGKKDYEKTVALYEKALPFMPDDALLKMFLGFNYLFVGKKAEGKKLLEQIKKDTFDYAVSPESIPEDYLSGKIDIEGIKAVFLHVDETRESIIEKQKSLEKILKRYPKFRAGLLHHAITYLQLGRGYEGQKILKRYHKIDPDNAVVEYYLTVLCLERLDYNRSWSYLTHTEELLAQKNHYPKVLKSLRQNLKQLCPKPD